jgi:hypothetical protein
VRRHGGGPIAHPELSLFERREEPREEGAQRGTSATSPAHGQRAVLDVAKIREVAAVLRTRELASSLRPSERARFHAGRPSRRVLAEADVNRVTQETVGRPGQIGDLRDKLRLDPVDAGKNERRSEVRAATRRTFRGDVLPPMGPAAP